WKISHQFMGVVLVFVGLHIGTITSDVSRNEPLKIWMLSVVAVGISAYMYKLIIYKNFTSKYNYVVDEIIKKGSIFELILNPKNENRPMIFEAGQYVFMRTADFKIGPEEHPFSISSPTNSKKIRLAIKILGDYTEQLSKIQKGAKLYLYGPYGDFSSKINTTPRIIAIAGGIGITPFLSILGSNMTDPATKMHLFYCTNNETDAVYKNELIATTKETSNIEIIFWYSSIKGKIQAAKTLAPEMGVFMQDARKDVRNTLVMLCGPTEMMASLAKQFIELGVPRKNIVFEDFALK
ncbi:MAG TPA: FAD-binding oxidoreductase, partial [bacterium]|nr:FAD-binding oxidoreductase [bacterium]